MLEMLPLARYRFRFRAADKPSSGHFTGSAWRGALGHSLRRAVCVTRAPRCDGCLLIRNCAYSYIFETPVPSGTARMRRYDRAPHPFTLVLPWPGERSYRDWDVGLTLFGRANEYLGYLIHALQNAGRRGIGKGRSVFELVSVEQEAGEGEWSTIYLPGTLLDARPPQSPDTAAIPGRVDVTLLTPLRIKRNDRLVTPKTFQFADLFSAVLRRISLLTYFHTDTPLEADFAALSSEVRAVALVDTDLRWIDWTRYSSRQDTTMEMGGLLGSLRIHTAQLAPFWSLLWLGQYTHAGKGASMGLGRYVIRAVLPSDRTSDH